MSITLIKALAGLGILGVTGLGGYGIYVVSRSGETIFEALSKRPGLTVLKTEGTDDDTKWDEKVTTLETSNSDPTLENYVKSTNNDETKKREENRANLKNICKKLFEASSSDTSKLAQAKKWCSKDTQ